MELCTPPGMLVNDVVFNLVIFCYQQGQASPQTLRILLVYSRLPTSAQVLSIASQSTKHFHMRDAICTLQQSKQFLLPQGQANPEAYILLCLPQSFSLYSYLECCLYRSQQHSFLWKKSYIHCQEFQRRTTISLACCTLEDEVDNYHQNAFPQIMLHLNMSNINDLLSDSRSLNHHWLTKVILNQVSFLPL